MDKRWILTGVLAIAILLLLVGCEQKETPQKKMNGGKTTASSKQQAVAQPENVTPINVKALPPPAFSLAYCNKRLTDIRNDLANAQDNLADERDDLQSLQAEARSSGRDAGIANANKRIQLLTGDVSSLQHGLQSMESKCNKVTPTICAEFLADARGEVADQQQELLNEQKELDYIRDSKKQELQRRKLILIQRRINEWTNIVTELETSCK